MPVPVARGLRIVVESTNGSEYATVVAVRVYTSYLGSDRKTIAHARLRLVSRGIQSMAGRSVVRARDEQAFVQLGRPYLGRCQVNEPLVVQDFTDSLAFQRAQGPKL